MSVTLYPEKSLLNISKQDRIQHIADQIVKILQSLEDNCVNVNGFFMMITHEQDEMSHTFKILSDGYIPEVLSDFLLNQINRSPR